MENLKRDYEQNSKEIVQHNLKMLEKDILELLRRESMGGNAGAVEIDGKKYSCAAANGYANQETGKIAAFGNIQDIDEEVLKNNLKFTLRVAFGQNRFFKIVNFHRNERLGQEALINIEKAIEEYNRENMSTLLKGGIKF